MNRHNLCVPVVLASCLMFATLSSSRAVSMEECLGMKNPTNSPVRVEAVLQKADLKSGVSLRVTIQNVSAAPYSLSVCPDMLMCAVRGLHPILAYDDTGMGLLDLCKCKPACSHEVLLLPNANYAFDLVIPPDRLPEAARQKGKKITVALCLELAGTDLYHSNSVEALLAE